MLVFFRYLSLVPVLVEKKEKKKKEKMPFRSSGPKMIRRGPYNGYKIYETREGEMGEGEMGEGERGRGEEGEGGVRMV